ncbi:L-threonylcarbamoyladenylate synthase [Streptomonospora wellingtoniae]|uniref:L-threonylcarbamoyladenylate synthase n=1 Tax=Streptomonospora wellingtoniae TaxID=3075544 RepID=A0ABU2KR20_9ACTN|nr:L-threonylcarbamoyladenylate synthase [Streptomonospora sp. DSM 45055]MDT0301719.1 L-threonylcarbamoyladenylate synthase [Streptomonospora sp. DSM 45055]
MSRSYDCADAQGRKDGIADAASSVRRGELVVLPTDTVYGIGADAFSPAAVSALLDAKGRGRDMPPPVLVGSVRAAQALIEDLGNYGQDLIEEFWPGPLTIVCAAAPSLSWDLGDTKGTVAVRMPMHPVALELLKEVGPMAVSSANLSGHPAATTAEEAEKQLGDAVAAYLDGGACADDTPSTIVDLTYAVPRVLRDGAISVQRLRAVCGTVIGVPKRRSTSEGETGDEAAQDGAEEPAGTGSGESPGAAGSTAGAAADDAEPTAKGEAAPAAPGASPDAAAAASPESGEAQRADSSETGAERGGTA